MSWSWADGGADANASLLGGKRRGSVNEEQAAPRERTMGIVPGAASMLNSVIGTGILALPIAFSRVGYVLGIVLLAVCCLLAGVSLVIIGICSTEVGATSYGTMIERALGPRWGKLSSVIVSLHMFGACLAYSLVIATNMTDLLNDQGWVGANQPILPGQTGDNWWSFDNRRFWIVAPAVGVVLPLVLLPNYNALRFASVTATSSMVYLTAVIAVLGFIGANRDGLPLWRGEADSRISSPTLPPAICCEQDDVTEDGVCTEAVEGGLYPAAVPWGQPSAVILDTDIFSSFSTFLFAFLSHSVAPQVVAEFKEPSTPRLAQMMGTVAGTCAMIYLFVGLMGYLQFSNCVCSNISVSYGPSGWVAVGQAFVVFSVIAGYPTNCWPGRDAVLELVWPLCCRAGGSGQPSAPSLTVKRFVAVLFLIFASITAWFDPEFDQVLALIGAFGGSSTAFVLPSYAVSASSTPQVPVMTRSFSEILPVLAVHRSLQRGVASAAAVHMHYPGLV